MTFEPRDTSPDSTETVPPKGAALPLDLAALVGSRLCHDLISPLGAIGNGVELLTMTGMAASPEVQLIAESVASANARIKFFRIAFGQAGPGHRLGRAEIVAVIAEMSRGGRLQIDWQVASDHPRRAVKLAFLAILCLEQALPWGGTLTITEAGDAWTLEAQAKRTKADPALWARLDGDAVPLTPAQVQFALLPAAARDQGRALRWEVGTESAAIRF